MEDSISYGVGRPVRVFFRVNLIAREIRQSRQSSAMNYKFHNTKYCKEIKGEIPLRGGGKYVIVALVFSFFSA